MVRFKFYRFFVLATRIYVSTNKMAEAIDNEVVWAEILESDDDSDGEDIFIASEIERLADKREEEVKRRNKHCTRLNLETISTEDCKKLFRFDKENLLRLRRQLRIPEELKASNRTRCSGIEGLCILLRRLAYPNRLSDLESIFGRGVAELSVIVNLVLAFVYDNWHHLLDDIPTAWLTNSRLQEGADAVLQLCLLPNVWGFIDGTAVAIARPVEGQRLFYSGHKRMHALKFQSIMTLFGIIAHLFGPVEGRRHDAAMLHESRVLSLAEQHLQRTDGTYWVMYGDPAYPNRPQLVRPYQGASLSPLQLEFNKLMSSARVCVEWGFGSITRLWAFVDFRKNVKILLQPVAKYYTVATLLTNCHTCIYGNNVATHFDVHPPTLAEYLQ